MKSTFTRILSAALALLMLLSVVLVTVACANSDEPEETTGTQGEVSEITEPETDGSYKPDFGNQTFDYKNEDFRFLTSGPQDDNGADWQTYDIWVERGDKGEPLNDAVYARNLYINETYHVNIVETQSTGQVFQQATRELKSGDDIYGCVVGNFSCLAQLADKGQLLNLMDFEMLDLSAPWWDQNVVSSCSINNRLYYATGDITVIDNDATWVLYFNTNMIAQKPDMLSPFELVENNEWTYEKFFEMMKAGAKGDDSSGGFNPETSIYGFTTTGDSSQGLLYASGIKIADKDGDDLPFNAVEKDIERLDGVVKLAAEIMNCPECYNVVKDGPAGTISANDIRKVFESNHAMFYGEVLQCAERMRGSETDFGLVTWPKYDATQTRYYNFVHASAGKAVSVPKTVMDVQRSAVILSAMAAESKNSVTVAYYDVCLGSKYLRDEVSRNMLDKISQSTVYDLGYIYNWGSLYSKLASSISSNKPKASSDVQKASKSFEKGLKKTVSKYNK